MRFPLSKVFAAFLLAVTCITSAPIGVYATTAPYAALRVTTTGGGNITLEPGETKKVGVSFQNYGSTTWKNDGPGYISLYTYGPKYRTSVFDPGTWLSATQIKRIVEPVVKPNEVATLLFDLRAPTAEGTYTETFKLAAEDKAWVEGAEFTMNITVKKASSKPVTTTTSTPTASSSSATGYTAELTAQTAKKLSVKAGKTVSFSVAFKNTGDKTWNTAGLAVGKVQAASTSADSLRTSTWNGSKVALVDGLSVKPGATLEIPFYFTAPQSNGTHNVRFNLTANDIEVPDAFVEIPVTVTEGSREVINAPIVEDTTSYIDEPTIRVGVLIVDEETDDEVYITSYQSDFKLMNTEGTVLGEYAKGKKVRAAYEHGHYAYGDDERSSSPLRFVPNEANAVMEITNFDRRVTRDTSYANNTFRNVLEIRYNSKKDRTWVINELPMEYYLRGLAETSNVSPMEYQKALLTAARTYAFYHWERTSKHAAEGYQVDAYRDQVYWGYGQEERTPRITEAVEATRGQIVTYDNKTAITAYFSRSDGRTRDWSDVWGGDVPWSKSVAVPCDVGQTMWGHGVGMSARGAICMAEDGDSWETILKYFYTGIDIQKKWK